MEGDSDRNSVTAEIESPEGITLGQLHDAARALARQHESCPFAPVHLHRRDGTVRVSVSFGGSILLNPNDPMATIIERHLIPSDIASIIGREWLTADETSNLELYVQAKRNGKLAVFYRGKYM